jgi:hypothetical protein
VKLRWQVLLLEFEDAWALIQFWPKLRKFENEIS